MSPWWLLFSRLADIWEENGSNKNVFVLRSAGSLRFYFFADDAQGYSTRVGTIEIQRESCLFFSVNIVVM